MDVLVLDAMDSETTVFSCLIQAKATVFGLSVDWGLCSDKQRKPFFSLFL